jgi:hypothetical protein
MVTTTARERERLSKFHVPDRREPLNRQSQFGKGESEALSENRERELLAFDDFSLNIDRAMDPSFWS